MQIKSQPWIHSWYGDSLGFFAIPLVAIFLAVFRLPPFRYIDAAHIGALITYVLIIDWAHIFAQWHRIYSNPLETSGKWIYPLSYFLLFPVVGLIFYLGYLAPVESFLVYFVIYHFIKQHYGFIRIYSKIDGVKTKFESVTESALIYLCMWTPVLYWHSEFPKKDFYWLVHFIKSPLVKNLFWPALVAYIFCFLAYALAEFKRTKRNGIFNWPKNLALLSAAAGWGLVSVFGEVPVLIFFTVVLTHDVSYIVFVWLIGRRDYKIRKNQVSWFSFWSIPGFLLFCFSALLLSQIIWAIYIETTMDQNRSYFIVGTIFNDLPSFKEGYMLNLCTSLFYATQAHHYFIDKYLWKKEKDLAYMVSTGKYHEQ